MVMRSEVENISAAKKAAQLNIEDTEDVKSKGLSIDIVDQIFEEFDDYTESMVSQWKDDAVWSDRSELINFLKLRHAAKRQAVLDKVVPDRICPECGELEIEDSHWRVDKWHSSAICWDCLKRNHNYRTINSQFYPGYDEWEIIYLMRNIFHAPKVRYSINGENLQKMRAMLGVTQKALSTAIGVTPRITQLYEEGETKTITRDRAAATMKLFKEYFVRRLEQLGYDMKKNNWHEPCIEEV